MRDANPHAQLVIPSFSCPDNGGAHILEEVQIREGVGSSVF